jgi:hypothetical protein
MRRLIFIVSGLAMLAVAGFAVAKNDGAKSLKAVAGTFTATSVSSRANTQTCKTTEGKTLVVTKGRYTGNALGDQDLAGPITLEARSIINTTDDVGIVTGKLRIDVTSGADTRAQFTAVYDHGRLAGLATGDVQDPRARLLANLSAGFSTTGGFTDGKIGNTSGGSALEIGPGRCQPAQAQATTKSKATGTISALSAGPPASITVGPLTCVVPASLAAKVSALKVGDRVEIDCVLANGQNTLTKVRKKD